MRLIATSNTHEVTNETKYVYLERLLLLLLLLRDSASGQARTHVIHHGAVNKWRANTPVKGKDGSGRGREALLAVSQELYR